MAMQQSGKGATGSGPSPALTDDQAEQFAASFTPAWDVEEGGDASANVAAAMAPAPVGELAPVAAAPGALAPRIDPKATLIGTAPAAIFAAPAPVAAAPLESPVRPVVPSSEAIEPENVLEVQTAPPVVTAAQQPRLASSPPPAPAPAAKTIAAAPRNAAPAAAAAVSTDPFRAPSAARSRPAVVEDDEDVLPKRSRKGAIFVVAGLVIAIGVGVFVKLGMADEAPAAAPARQLTGPAATTAEIPPPLPEEELAAPATAAPRTPDPTPAQPARAAEPAAAAPRAAVAPAAAAPVTRSEPKPARASAPAVAAAPPPAAATPKSPPKGPNGGIVRDNPF